MGSSTEGNQEQTSNAQRGYCLPTGFERCSKLKPVAQASSALERVKAIVDILYSPGGCPWDGKQTNRSLLKPLLEETYEYVDAVETNDRDNMREELGDVLLQSVFQARVCAADLTDPFDIDEVADRLVNKLITRHPHVFEPDDDADDAENEAQVNESTLSTEETLALWERMKQQEKHRKSVLEGISHAQGALPRAAKVVSRIMKSVHKDELLTVFDDAIKTNNAQYYNEEAISDSPITTNPSHSKASIYADEILAIVRHAQSEGIDIEAALRNRLRDAETVIVSHEQKLDDEA
ncbi:MazG family protein [Bifidobacterium felsineum]|uniref:Nucleotide pyrophosphohydrolase n=1 Tax=Bifidobacterium felsineum TaxID=2045440 RepID=A0A2M9HKA3_9BIFI|nr:MazG family protein [Bifidobacterium felsineum]MBT1164421.1 MazG family protein [Bifidobacterium felsineum]PJM77248.1 nucleotide pyrophosphohydrolase [Bifidobacterium felsineum]